MSDPIAGRAPHSSLDLDAVLARYEAAFKYIYGRDDHLAALVVSDNDVPDLVAEIKALRASSESTPEPGSEKRPQADAEPSALPDAETCRHYVTHYQHGVRLCRKPTPCPDHSIMAMITAAMQRDALAHAVRRFLTGGTLDGLREDFGRFCDDPRAFTAIAIAPQDAPAPAPSSETQSSAGCASQPSPASSEDGEPAQDDDFDLAGIKADWAQYGGRSDAMVAWRIPSLIAEIERLRGVRRVSLPDAVREGLEEKAWTFEAYAADSHSRDRAEFTKAEAAARAVTIRAFLRGGEAVTWRMTPKQEADIGAYNVIHEGQQFPSRNGASVEAAVALGIVAPGDGTGIIQCASCVHPRHDAGPCGVYDPNTRGSCMCAGPCVAPVEQSEAAPTLCPGEDARDSERGATGLDAETYDALKARLSSLEGEDARDCGRAEASPLPCDAERSAPLPNCAICNGTGSDERRANDALDTPDGPIQRGPEQCICVAPRWYLVSHIARIEAAILKGAAGEDDSHRSEPSSPAPTVSDAETRTLIERLRDLHKSKPWHYGSTVCVTCHVTWPCPTADALEAAARRPLPLTENEAEESARDKYAHFGAIDGAAPFTSMEDAYAYGARHGATMAALRSESTDARRVATPGFAEADDDETCDLRSAFFFIGDTDRASLDKAVRFDNNAHGPTLSDEWFANVVVVVEGIVEREVDRRAGVVVPRTEVDSRFAEWWANAGRRVTPESSREGLGYVAFCAGVRFGVSQPTGLTGATGEPVTARAETDDQEAEVTHERK